MEVRYEENVIGRYLIAITPIILNNAANVTFKNVSLDQQSRIFAKSNIDSLTDTSSGGNLKNSQLQLEITMYLENLQKQFIEKILTALLPKAHEDIYKYVRVQNLVDHHPKLDAEAISSHANLEMKLSQLLAKDFQPAVTTEIVDGIKKSFDEITADLKMKLNESKYWKQLQLPNDKIINSLLLITLSKFTGDFLAPLPEAKRKPRVQLLDEIKNTYAANSDESTNYLVKKIRYDLLEKLNIYRLIEYLHESPKKVIKFFNEEWKTQPHFQLLNNTEGLQFLQLEIRKEAVLYAVNEKFLKNAQELSKSNNEFLKNVFSKQFTYKELPIVGRERSNKIFSESYRNQSLFDNKKEKDHASKIDAVSESPKITPNKKH